MADKSPRQHQSKKAGKTLKEKRSEKKAKAASKRPLHLNGAASAADVVKRCPARGVVARPVRRSLIARRAE